MASLATEVTASIGRRAFPERMVTPSFAVSKLLACRAYSLKKLGLLLAGGLGSEQGCESLLLT